MAGASAKSHSIWIHMDSMEWHMDSMEWHMDSMDSIWIIPGRIKASDDVALQLNGELQWRSWRSVERRRGGVTSSTAVVMWG